MKATYEVVGLKTWKLFQDGMDRVSFLVDPLSSPVVCNGHQSHSPRLVLPFAL